MRNSTSKDFFKEIVLEEQSLEKEDDSKQKPPFEEQIKFGPFPKINPDGLILPDWSLRKGSTSTTTKMNSSTQKKFIETIFVGTPIATDIRTTDIDARYDSQAKILFSHRVYLAWLLKENVEVYRRYSIDQIANEFIEPVEIGTVPLDRNERFQGESLRPKPGPRIIGLSNEDNSFVEGVVYFDILFRVLDPTRPGDYFIVNLEIQNNARPGYDLNKRIDTYNSRLISLQKNRVYAHSDYNNLKRVLSFWLILNPGKADENIVEEHTTISKVKRPGMGVIETRENIGSVRTWKLYVGNPDVPDCPKIIRLTGTLVSKTYSISQKRRILEGEFQISMKEELERRLTDMCNLSEGIREEGVQQGIQQGFQIGYQAAEQEYKPVIEQQTAISQKAIIKLIGFMLKTGYSFTEALKEADVPLESESAIRELVKKEYPELLI